MTESKMNKLSAQYHNNLVFINPVNLLQQSNRTVSPPGGIQSAHHLLFYQLLALTYLHLS